MVASVRLFDFHGIVPLRDPTLINAAYAMVAEDVDLSRGKLTPWKFGDPVLTASTNIKSVVDSEQCGFITWDTDTEYTFGYPVCNDIGMMFWIENGVVQQGTRADICNGSHLPLRVPCPTDTASAGGLGGGSEGCTTYASFCYTYVNKYGQESSPSYPSDVAVSGTSGVSVSVGGAPSGFGIVKIRVYRAVADNATGQEQSVGADGEWVLVGEGDSGGGSISTNPIESTAEILPSGRWSPPPENITTLAVCPTSNALMLGSGNNIYVSHPGQYHAFPRDRDVVLSDNVVALRFYAGDMMVLTDGHPYVITPRSMQDGPCLYKHDRQDESIPCLSRPSVAIGTAGIIWASTDGLFLLGTTRNYGMRAQCITDKLFHLDDWREADPTTIRGEVYNGAYYFTCSNQVTCHLTKHQAHTWILTFNDLVYEHPTNVELTSLTIRPDRWYRSRKDVLYYSIENELYEWNPYDGEVQPFHYVSRDIVEVGLVNYSIGKVIHDRDGYLFFEIFKEKCCRFRSIFRRKIDHCDPFRLPRCLLGIDHYVKLVGTSCTHRVHLASSMTELTYQQDTTYTYGNQRLTSR